MTQTLQIGRGPLVLVVAGCLAVGSLGTYFLLKRQAVNAPPSPDAAAPLEPASAGAKGDAVITLTPEAVARLVARKRVGNDSRHLDSSSAGL